mgnify:FL=1
MALPNGVEELVGTQVVCGSDDDACKASARRPLHLAHLKMNALKPL